MLDQPVGRGRENREEGNGKGGESFRERERESTFSLDFSTICSSNPGEARGKVDPHCKGYTWVPVLGGGGGGGGFRQLREVGVFSYLVISCLKIH